MALDVTRYAARLEELYERQLARADSNYLRAHAVTRGGILRQVRAAELYLPHVRGRVLDWGCYHAPDACLVRLSHGPDVEIHGCDVHPADTSCFTVFHAEAGLRYRQVRHPYHLPYDDDYFDTVIADGTLEHVPNDRESLKELYRVLRPDGLLVVSCLPNARSWIEALSRRANLPHHLRTYTMRQARSLLLHSGFEPVRSRYLQMMPTLSGTAAVAAPAWLRAAASALWGCNSALERLWPLNRLSSNLFLLARKRVIISWTPEYAARHRLWAPARAA